MPLSGFARMYEEPRSFSLNDKSQEKIERKILAKVDAERLLAEDQLREKDPKRPGPLRFAVAQEVAFTTKNSGTWQNVTDGRVWRLRIQSPEAKSLNLGITRFEMPKGAKLWIYDPGHKQVEGPYTSEHRSRQGRLWTPVIEGDEIVVEVFVPTETPEPVVEIRKVNHGYRGFEKTGEKSGIAGTEGACNNDVICPAGDSWRNQIRAVGVYTVNAISPSSGMSETYVCSGVLLNDTANDFRPFFLSANHCRVDGTNDDSVVVYWNFESPMCNTHAGGDRSHTQTGSTIRARWEPSDFLLLELSAAPDPSFNVFHAGWDASGSTPPSTVCIHHPVGDVKAISSSNNPPHTRFYNSFFDNPGGDHWHLLWDSGVTEGGSSGAPLFDTSTGRCIGQLDGGHAGCGHLLQDDFFGKFSVSWTGGGTATTRLSDWLDPGNTGTMAIDGDPHITTANGVHYDFQSAGEFVSLRDVNGLEIQTRQTPVPTASVVGPNSHTGLTTCVSVNTAVAARVGKRRVTYQADSDRPDPDSAPQLRVDGVLTTLGANGLDLGDGGRVMSAPVGTGIQINFPDGTILIATANFWSATWYLNIDLFRLPAVDGIPSGPAGSFPNPATGGIAGAIAKDSWLPALPDGTSMGPRPASLHQRYIDLYQKFADAWRVTDRTSLFDYTSGTSTATFTIGSWPPEHSPCALAEKPPVKPINPAGAREVCGPIVDQKRKADCVFDVTVTGERGFAKAYLLSQQIELGLTRVTLSADKNSSKPEEPVIFTAAVVRNAPVTRRELRDKYVPTGSVQFMVDDEKAGDPIKLDSKGHATWKTSGLKPENHRVAAIYTPNKGSVFMRNTSRDELHSVVK